MDKLLDEAWASSQVTPRKDIRSGNIISTKSSQMDTKSVVLPNFKDVLSRGSSINTRKKSSPSSSQSTKFSNSCPNGNNIPSRDSTEYEIAIKDLIITYRREVTKLKHEINFLSKKLDSGGIVSCPSCNHKFRHRDNLVLPKYIKVLRGRLMLEMEFLSIDNLEEWLTLNSLEDAAGGYANLRKSEVPTTLTSCESQLKNMLKEETLKSKIRIPLGNKPCELPKQDKKDDFMSDSSHVGVNPRTNRARTDNGVKSRVPLIDAKSPNEEELLRKSPLIVVNEKNTKEGTLINSNLNVRTDEEVQVTDNHMRESRNRENDELRKKSSLMPTKPSNAAETKSEKLKLPVRTAREQRISAKEKESARNEDILGRPERETSSKKAAKAVSRIPSSHARTDRGSLMPDGFHKEDIHRSRNEEVLRRSPRKQTKTDVEMEVKSKIDLIVENRRNLGRGMVTRDRNNRSSDNNSGVKCAPIRCRIGRNDHLQSRNQSRNPLPEAPTSVDKSRRGHRISSSDRYNNRHRGGNSRSSRGDHRLSQESCRSSTRTSDRLNTRSPAKRKATSPVAYYSSKRAHEISTLSEERRFNNDDKIESKRRINSRESSDRKMSSTSMDTPHMDFEELIEVDATDTVEPEGLHDSGLTVRNAHPSSTPSSVFSMPTSVTSRLIIDEDVEDGELLTDEDELGLMNTTLNRTLTTPNHGPMASPPAITMQNSADFDICENGKADTVVSVGDNATNIYKEVSLKDVPRNKDLQGTSYDGPELASTHMTSEDKEQEQENISPISKLNSSLPPLTDVRCKPVSQMDDSTIGNYVHSEQPQSTSNCHMIRRQIAPIKEMRKKSHSINPSSSSSDENENINQETFNCNADCDADGTGEHKTKPGRSSESSSNSGSDCFGGIAVDNEDDIFSDSFEPKSSDCEESDFFADSGSDNGSVH